MDLDQVKRAGDTPIGQRVQMLSLDNQWLRCEVDHNGGILGIDAPKGITGGMSGSPVINDAGAAVGVISCSGGGPDEVHTQGIGARLVHNLPAGVLQAIQRVD